MQTENDPLGNNYGKTEEQQLIEENLKVQNDFGIELQKEFTKQFNKKGMFENKIIIVFGGTGTIGSLIIEYLLTQKPKSIRVFNLSENSQWELQQRVGYGINNEVRYIKGDIRNVEKVRLAVRGCDFVFNAAANKHVPIAEYNPIDTVETNILGLNNIITACVENNISKLLHISTDKSVNPRTLMGATKLIGERLVQIRWSQHPTVQMVVVRLGNVYGSRGSFVQIVRQCLAEGKSIPITSKEMYRYFMQPQEVIQFIVKAFVEGKEGEVWVPKLKESKLMDIAHAECEIQLLPFNYHEIGVRKGEKLREKLITKEELARCREEKGYWVIPTQFGV